MNYKVKYTKIYTYLDLKVNQTFCGTTRRTTLHKNMQIFVINVFWILKNVFDVKLHPLLKSAGTSLLVIVVHILH